MKKILIVSTVSRQFYLFEQGNIEVLHSLGYEVHAAANFCDTNERLNALNIVRHPFDIQRSPFSIKNIKAYKQLKQIMKEENFDAVHCHSPMGGVLARLAAKSVGVKSVIYTAHGFHFYKGAPLINWLIYYPVEKLLAKYTNVLITINKEDHNRAKRFKADKIAYIQGIGIDIEKFSKVVIDKNKKRDELGLPRDAFVILSVGELNKNKNHEVIMRALAEINHHNIYYVICGQGVQEEYLKKLAISLNVKDTVKFLGYRNDMPDIYKIADVFAFPSYREGLSVSLMEAMSSGLPCVVSKIRGNIDLIDECKGGYLCEPDDVHRFAVSILKLSDNESLRQNMGQYNLRVIKKYSIQNVKKIMREIYQTEACLV